MTPERRSRIVADAMSKFKYGPKAQPSVDAWQAKLETLVTTTQSHIKQICQAGGAAKPDDLKALRETTFTMLLQSFDSWSKEELMFLTTTLIADRLMQDVEANPWGNASPDAIS